MQSRRPDPNSRRQPTRRGARFPAFDWYTHGVPYQLTWQDERIGPRDTIVSINTGNTGVAMPRVTVSGRATDRWPLRHAFAGRNGARQRRLLKTEK